MSTPTPTPVSTKVSWLSSVGWSALVLGLVPAGLAILWLAGRTWTSLTSWVSHLGVSWANVAWGAAVVAGYVAVTLVVHAARSHRAQMARYRQVIDAQVQA